MNLGCPELLRGKEGAREQANELLIGGGLSVCRCLLPTSCRHAKNSETKK